MTDDLVKRLRNYDELEQDRDGQIICQKCEITQEAADRIEQLVATNKQLTAERDVSNELGKALEEDAGQLRAERDRLREALNGLLTSVEHADFAEGWCCCGDYMLHHQNPMDCGHTPVDIGVYHASLAIEKARAALKGESHE